MALGAVVTVAVQDELRRESAQSFHLRRRGGLGADHGGLQPEAVGSPRDPERVVPGRSSDDMVGRIQQGERRQRPAHLERPGRLLRFELQQDIGAERARDQRGRLEKRTDTRLREPDVLGRRKHAPTVRPVRVLTLGETMVLLDGVEGGLAHGAPFRLRLGGAESNFGIALVRLGVPVSWVSRLGADPLGDVVYETLAGEGLDLRFVSRDQEAPTAVFFKWHEDGESRVLYRRAGSAASRLAPDDVPPEAFDGVGLVHLTGITMALSGSARAAVLAVAAEARARGIPVMFDPNYRPALWPGPREAEAGQRAVLPNVDWYLCGEHEGCLLFGVGSAAEVLDAARAAGASEAAVRVGARGAVVAQDGEAVEVPPHAVEEVVDEIGAGDGFAAGFAYGLLHGWGPVACARAGNLIAAHALRGTGDWETFPRFDEVAGDLSA